MSKQTYYVKNLNCPNCAKKIEKSIAGLNGIKAVKLDFSTTKLFIESDDAFEVTQLQKVVSKIEPSIILEREKPKAEIVTKVIKNDILILIIGFILSVIGLLLPSGMAQIVFLYIAGALLLYKTFIKSIVLLVKNKTINENFLLVISVVGAYVINKHMEGLMVIILYSIGKILENISINNSRKNIVSLMEIKAEFARVIRNGKEEEVNPEKVEVGEIILVLPGERIALDGEVVGGSSAVNVSHITGESMPALLKIGSIAISGSIVQDGLLEIKTTSAYENSTVKKIMDLIENATAKKSKTETFVSRVARWYALGVIALAVVVILVAHLAFQFTLVDSFYRGLVLLVISCPCAFAISVPLSYFSGIGRASKAGILVKGSNYLDLATQINEIIFDKTGTLTTGVFSVEEVVSNNEKYSKEEILRLSVLGEQHSTHPIAKAIFEYGKNIKLEKVDNFKEISGKGIFYLLDGKQVFIGKNTSADNTSTSVIVKVDNDEVGYINLSDQVKNASKKACDRLVKQNIKISMLSGDNKIVTQKVADVLNIKEYSSSLLPEEKYASLEKKLQENKKGFVAFVGDGLNDAPSLTRADLGISMGLKGSTASIEASDIVLADDNPNKINHLIKISKFTKKIILQNISFAVLTKLTFLVLGTLGLAGMLGAVFADVGVTLITILNTIRIIKYRL